MRHAPADITIRARENRIEFIRVSPQAQAKSIVSPVAPATNAHGGQVPANWAEMLRCDDPLVNGF